MLSLSGQVGNIFTTSKESGQEPSNLPEPLFPSSRERAPLFHLDAATGVKEAFAPRHVDGWDFRPEGNHRWGWISEEPGSTITFLVPVRQGTIHVGFLRSYENMGCARVRITDAFDRNLTINSKILAGHWRRRISVFQEESIPSELGSSDSKGVLKRVNVEFSLLGACSYGNGRKFKLLSLTGY